MEVTFTVGPDEKEKETALQRSGGNSIVSGRSRKHRAPEQGWVLAHL